MAFQITNTQIHDVDFLLPKYFGPVIGLDWHFLGVFG